jgi:hypothetical protein
MPSQNDLREILLAKVGYSSPAPTCVNCKFFSEREDPHLDRSWVAECTQFGNAGPVAVSKQGVCKSFAQKTVSNAG